MRRVKGSILIEVIASIMILTLTSIFIVSASIKNLNVIRERTKREEVNRAICNIIKELDYNNSKQEIDELLKDGKTGFKYDENLSQKLMDVGIKDLERGDNIQIIKISEDSRGMNLKVTANIVDGISNLRIEKDFTKSWWMDEV